MRRQFFSMLRTCNETYSKPNIFLASLSKLYFVLVLFCFQLCFQVQKLGVNFATKFASTFQCLNYCEQMSVVQVEINNSMESSWSSGLPRRFVFRWIGYYYGVWTFVYKRSSNIEMNLRTLLRSSRPISELGNVKAQTHRQALIKCASVRAPLAGTFWIFAGTF
jgi:hypothetical protein